MPASWRGACGLWPTQRRELISRPRPRVLTKVAESPFCQKIYLNLMQGNSRIGHRNWDLQAPDLFAGLIQDLDCVTSAWLKRAHGPRCFHQKRKASGLIECVHCTKSLH